MTMGLCIRPFIDFPIGHQEKLNAPFYRAVLYHVVEDLEWLLGSGRPILLTLNNEADLVKSDWGGWENALRYIAGRSKGRVIGLSCANELDLYHDANPADVAPDFAAY